MDLCCVYSFGATLKMNEANADTLVPRAITGLDGRPVRRTVEPKGGADGANVLPARFGARLPVFSGDINIMDPNDMSKAMDPFTDLDGYRTKLNTLMAAWVTGMEALLNTSFTLAYTPLGVTAVSLTAYYGIEGNELQFGGATVEPTFSLGLFIPED